MEQFFDTIYLYTSGLYGQELDNYLYETVPGYLHIGLIMLVLTVVIAILFYYMFKPVRHQYAIWFGCVGVNAFLNLIVALWYTNTPLINHEIVDTECWTVLDTFGVGFANILWSVVAFVIVSFIIKWWSPAKYVPFKKF